MSSIKDEEDVKIWAHRGCSYRYPENTLEAFEAACKCEGITGIEFDVQLSKDNEIVVIHDETVNRTTDGTGKVKELTLKELKALKIAYYDMCGENIGTRIPTLQEVLELTSPYCRRHGLLLNIELKNSVEPYEGMEEAVLRIIKKNKLEQHIVYSTFSEKSLEKLNKLDSSIRIAVLQETLSKCLEISKRQKADALHPSLESIDSALPKECEIKRVRAWNRMEPFYGQSKKIEFISPVAEMRQKGITDFITNVPEQYLE